MRQRLSAGLLLLAPLTVSGRSAELGTDNTCPSGKTRIGSGIACRAALQLLGYDGSEYKGEEPGGADESWPAGCYRCDGVAGCQNGVWFNPAGVGSVNGGANVICADGLEPLSKGGLLFAGDSDIDGWASEQKWPNSYNVGVGGATCLNVKKEAAALVEAFLPSWVVLVCGENDLMGASVSSTFSRLRKSVERLTSSGSRVLYIGTKPEPSTKNLHDEYTEYDAKVKQLAADLAASSNDGRPPLVMVDSFSSFEQLGNPSSLYKSDRLHLSGGGYAYWEAWVEVAMASDVTACEVFANGVCVQGQGIASPTPTAVPAAQCLADIRKTHKCKKRCAKKTRKHPDGKCHKKGCKKKCATTCCAA